MNLFYGSRAHRRDREIVFTAVSQNGRALMLASDGLKHDHAIVLAAVTQVCWNIHTF